MPSGEAAAEIRVETLDSGRLLANAAFLPLLKASSLLDAEALWSLEGKSVKKVVKERGTERVFLKGPSGEQVEAYLKRYTNPPLKERLKAALSLKFKVFGAFDEWESLLAFHRAGLPTMTPIAVARCEGGECALTLGITGYVKAAELLPSIKDCRERRRTLVKRIAALAAGMHSAGMAHQDFYLVHMFVTEGDKVNLIDLQRVVRSPKLARRWIVKDLGQLLFSASPLAMPGEIALFLRDYVKARKLSLKEAKALAGDAAAKAAAIEARDAAKRKARA